jgi:hypothetical protein
MQSRLIHPHSVYTLLELVSLTGGLLCKIPSHLCVDFFLCRGTVVPNRSVDPDPIH